LPITLVVKSDDSAVKEQRESTARRVIDYFGDGLPPTKLLCFLDDNIPLNLTEERGLYMPIRNMADFDGRLSQVRNCVYRRNFDGSRSRVIAELVYLHGTTCKDDVGLTMTLAHELQHAIQYNNVRRLWAVNGIVTRLHERVIVALNLRWADIPIEHESRIISKRVAVLFFGEQQVTKYINQRIKEHVSDSDVADWQFIQTLTPTDSVDLVDDTRKLFQKLKDYRPELEGALREMKKCDPEDFGDIDLDAFFQLG
jgi:hypothetical protein